VSAASGILITVTSSTKNNATNKAVLEAVEAVERRYSQFAGIYEPSAIVFTQGGFLVVVEDETARPIHILDPVENLQSFKETAISTKKLFNKTGKYADFRKLDDLEGIDVSDDGYIYAITSHTRGKKGRKPNREKLVRFKIEGQRITKPSVYGDLKEGLTKHFKVLRDAAEVADVKNQNGLNIEGLSFNKKKDRMLIGFRGPVVDGRAMIVELENLTDLFENKAPPQFGKKPIYLDLGGRGIRGMKYDSRLQGYLIISGPVKKIKEPFHLWLWNGSPSHKPRRVSVDGVKGFERAEGITQVKLSGKEQIMIVYDDGNREQKKTGRYLLLSYDELKIR
jgi:hypothetical protein